MDEEGTIDLNAYRKSQEFDDDKDTIDLASYKNSKEAKQASWWDSAREAGIQSVLGLGKAFTYPADILKLAMLGEGLSDVEEIEEAFKKEGKTFDKDKYVRTVFQQGEFIPTQELLERSVQKKTGIDLEPKTKTGKAFNKLFFLTGLSRAQGLPKALKTGAVGAGTTSGLRAAGAPELVSELGGDATAAAASLTKQTRKLSPEAKRLQEVADKRGLPFMEFMTKEELPNYPKITKGRKAALEKNLGMSSEQAIKGIIEERIPVSRLRNSGADLEALETEAYDQVKQLASKQPQALNTDQIVNDIDREISRIKTLAPSPSDAQMAAIRILQNEKDALGKGTANAQQLINQTQNYNSNVKSIYKRPEFSGVQDEVKNAYAFLNNSIRNNIESQAGKEVTDALKAANSIYGQNAALARTEGFIGKAFKDGKYNPKKLSQLLDSKQGAIVRRDIGQEGVKDLREIAKYGEQAQNATAQFANSAKNQFVVGQWGPLAGFLLAKIPVVGAVAATTKPVFDYVRGWALTQPAARSAYANIVKNAAKGSYKNMAKDFAVLESEASKQFGSVEEFLKNGMRELQLYREGEEDEI